MAEKERKPRARKPKANIDAASGTEPASASNPPEPREALLDSLTSRSGEPHGEVH